MGLGEQIDIYDTSRYLSLPSKLLDIGIVGLLRDTWHDSSKTTFDHLIWM